ncbi:MAG: class I SAM-dependent methyltransferase [Bacteroidota bacterium]|nr:class I SAM-dependent methyltransferase [Bacteroidota bacterium]
MFEVPATSAFVLLFTSEEVYEGEAAKRLMRSVDLSAGLGIKNYFSRWWEDIYEEVGNRKCGMQFQSRTYLDDHPDAQVVCLGGGLDPLSLDLAECYPEAVVFDVDMANMDLKEEINAGIDGPAIRFCTGNLADPAGLVRVLESAGWDAGRRTLMIAEGITYYVPKQLFRDTFAALCGPGGGIVLEYSLPDSEVEGTPRADEYMEFFQQLRAILDMPFPIQRYSPADVEELAAHLGGRVIITQLQHELEFMRKGENILRLDPTQGSIRISTILFD